MNVIGLIIKKQRISIIVTAVVLLVGSLYYFIWGSPYPGMTYVYRDMDIYRTLRLAATYKEGALTILALADPAALGKYRAARGVAVPGENTIVLGSEKAAEMKKEGLFRRPGDTITGLFGIDPVVGGVLKRTYTIVDEMCFLTEADMKRTTADIGRIFLVPQDDGPPKLFLTMEPDDYIPIELPFAEGSRNNYVTRKIGNKTYYPLILGADEAVMMRDEDLFDRPGETIRGFVGHDVIVVGVLKKTGTIIDTAHISPLTEADISIK